MLTTKQKQALDMMLEGKNIFLTGKAGTGKSFVLKQFLELPEVSNKNVLVTAPTGIASINIGGSTLHNTFKIPVDILKTLKKPRNVNDVIKNADIIVIDEISMCRIDIFEYVCKSIEIANTYRKKKSKKSIQVILVGDFFQLPPVKTATDTKVLNHYYNVSDIGGAYAFQSEYWRALEIEMIELDEVVRQNEPEFIEALNHIRKGSLEGLKFFNELKNEKNEKAIFLNAMNKQVDKVNQEKLDELEGKTYYSYATISGNVPEFPTSQKLTFKKNCRVIMIKNDSVQGFVNGDLGTIKKVNKNNLEIKLDSGKVVKVEEYTWKFTVPTLVQDEEGITHFESKEVGSFTQFPIKIAYAITMHKSQGMTYETVNIAPFSLTDGQLYVALSRARTSKNLCLNSLIMPKYLHTSKEVCKFYENPKTYSFFDKKEQNNDLNEDNSEIKKEFEILWQQYPNKKGKEDAFLYYEMLRKRKDDINYFEMIKDGISRYVNYIETKKIDSKYIKNGSTFFVAEGWNDSRY